MKRNATLPSVMLVVGMLISIVHPAFGQQKVSWQQLAEIEYVQQDQRWVPQFSEKVQQLDGKEVQLQGFMIPLDQSMEQRHFILSAYPVEGCQFCMPGGPEAMIEVEATEGIAFTYNPIALRGTLHLTADNPYGLLYRIVEARPL